MQFHLPSFLLGYGSGIVTALFADRLRPVLVELGAMAYRALGGAGAVLETRREDVEDILAEAKARAGVSHVRPAPKPAPRKERRVVPGKRRPAAKRGAIRAVEARK